MFVKKIYGSGTISIKISILSVKGFEPQISMKLYRKPHLNLIEFECEQVGLHQSNRESICERLVFAC